MESTNLKSNEPKSESTKEEPITITPTPPEDGMIITIMTLCWTAHPWELMDV